MGTIGGTFFNRKLEDRRNLEASSIAFLSSPPSLNSRPRLMLLRTLSGTSVEITLSDVLRRTVAIESFVDAQFTDLVRFKGFGSNGGATELAGDESLLEFHDEISDPLSLTVSELKLFFLNVLPSHFTLGFGVVDGLLANIVLALLMDPHAWALPVQPLWISVLSGVMIGT